MKKNTAVEKPAQDIDPLHYSRAYLGGIINKFIETQYLKIKAKINEKKSKNKVK